MGGCRLVVGSVDWTPCCQSEVSLLFLRFGPEKDDPDRGECLCPILTSLLQKTAPSPASVLLCGLGHLTVALTGGGEGDDGRCEMGENPIHLPAWEFREGFR